MAASASSELLQAQVELQKLQFAYLKSMALKCAVELGIPNAIHRHGDASSLSDLLATVPVPEHRRHFLPRLLRYLTVTGVLAVDAPAAGEADKYSLTSLSRLLVDVTGCTSLAPRVLAGTTKYHVMAAMHLSEWFRGRDSVGVGVTAAPLLPPAETPFKMAHAVDFWEAMDRDQQFNEVFNFIYGLNPCLIPPITGITIERALAWNVSIHHQRDLKEMERKSIV